MNDNYMKEVGSRIRETRKRQGMTMKELGNKIGLHESSVSRIEKGESSIELNKLKEIAKILGVSSAYLCGWKTKEIEQVENIIKNWNDIVGEMYFSDSELQELANYAKYIISKR